jgi:5-methylcytosine-specific restriction enzyme A
VTNDMAKLRTFPPRLRTFGTELKVLPKVKGSPYYDPAWVALRARIVRQRGSSCEDSAHDPARPRRGRVIADHIVELKDGGELLDPKNILLRCSRCHGRKTMEARARRR